MVEVHPFQAVSPAPSVAASVASLPYDVVSAEQARTIVADNPLSFLRVLRAEVDLPPDTDPVSETVYQRAADNYRQMKEQRILVRNSEPALYLYSLLMDGHRQTGLAALCRVDDYENNLVRKHEKTRPDKEDDRTRHMLALRAQTGLVFLACPGGKRLKSLLAEGMSHEPLFDFTAADNIRHTLWRLPSALQSQMIHVIGEQPALYIADGHHRDAAAARVRESLRAENPGHHGREAYNFFPVVIFPAGQLRVLPYNRVVRGLGGYTPESLLGALTDNFKVELVETPQPRSPGKLRCYLDGSWFELTLRHPEKLSSASVDRLDVSILQDFILSPLLAVDNPRTDRRIDFIGGIDSVGELVRRVDSGRADVAFSLYPTTVEQLMGIADTGSVMPPKSTWFEPKLRDGLLVHEL